MQALSVLFAGTTYLGTAYPGRREAGLQACGRLANLARVLGDHSALR